MSDPADPRDLDSFEARLAKAKARHQPDPRDIAVSALARGTRHAFEIAATTLVGAGLGWWLDRWLGTAPWGFLLLLLLGVAAGFWNLLKQVNAEAAAMRSRQSSAAGAPADNKAGQGGQPSGSDTDQNRGRD